MRGRYFSTVVLVGLGVFVSAGRADAVSTQDALCRKMIGKGVRLLSDAVLKEKAKCHKLRMLGTIDMGTDCNDISQLPGLLNVQRKRDQLATLTANGCAAASTPQQNGYVICRSPCESVAISDYPSVVQCQQCLAESNTGDAITQGYGNPPVPAMNDPRTQCQTKIGTALRKYYTARVKEQQRCQFSEDTTPMGNDCRTYDPRQKVARALTAAKLLIARCDPAVLAMLNSCGANTTAEQNCVQTADETGADASFADVYLALSGVFVSSSVGSGGGDGSILNPVDTINAGIALASANSKPDVFIDGGVYTESITLGSNVKLRAGFNSSNSWVHDGSTTSVFGGTTAMLGSSVTNVSIDGLNISATGTLATGASSYGVRLIGSTGVTIKNCTVTAGGAGSGTAGSNGSTGAGGGGGSVGGNGCESSSIFCSSCGRPGGGGGGSNGTCSGHNGGGGGQPGNPTEGNSGGDTGGGGQGAGAGSGGAGGSLHNIGGTGGNGSPGAAGGNGAAGASFGSAGSTYSPAGGTSGSNGSPGGGAGGGGGGGGGDSTCDSWGGGGGGGGAGGCGGTFATTGTGAGGSFGVWVSGGTATVNNTTINTGNGGTGGSGGTGGGPGSGGSGAFGGSSSDDDGPGGKGGNGGSGGQGGHGGGGGGGPSIGIVCTGGAAVARTGNTINLGSAGAGGSSAGNPGAAGLHVNESGC